MSQAQMGPDHGSTPGTPGWVKAFVITGLVLVLLYGILHLTGNSPVTHTTPMEHRVQPPTSQP